MWEWQLLIPHPRDINVKVQNSNDNNKDRSTINDIKRTLTTEQFEAFRRTPFGKFFDLPHCIVQNQLINHILLREVHQNRSDEVWFDFGGKLLRFGIEEFAVITGLKCIGKTKKLNIPKISGGLHDKFLDGVELSRNHIRWQFLKKAWSCDEDAMKFAKLHLLANFLMGSQEALRIDRCYVDLIDSPKCDDHAWGKEVFDFTLYYLKKSIHSREQMHIYEKPEGSGYLYRCYGLILALQTWFYEVCDTAEGVICTSVGDRDIPRLLKWEFKNIVPTEEEKLTLSLDSFFKKKNEFTRNDIPSSPTTQHTNDVDVISRLDSISAELETLKQAFFEFSKRVMAEFELFREKFIPASHVPVQNVPQPDVHVPSGVDDDDPFHEINTQFLEEIDRTLQEKLNESSRRKEPRGFTYEPHPIFGYALNGSQPSFDAITAGLPPTPPHKKASLDQQNNSGHVQKNVDEERFNTGPVEHVEKIEAGEGVNRGTLQEKKVDIAEKGLDAVQANARVNSAMVVYDPKAHVVKKTTKARKKLKTDVPVKIRLQHSRPLAGDFDITISGRVHTGIYDEWIAEGTLQCAPRKVANGYTTTDVLFDQHIKSLYTSFLSQSRNLSVCTVNDMIIDYITGYKIICGLSWFKVDHVLFPIHLEINNVGHWIMGLFSFDDMKLRIYNSIRTQDCDNLVMENVKAYVELIPIFLDLVRFPKKSEHGPHDVIMVDNVPQQLNSDCGIYVASFAEYFIAGHDITKTNIDATVQRHRYGYLLYTHGLMKQTNGYESDDESPGSLPDEVRFGFLKVLDKS
ncbi:Domain of unknown function (DUF1985 [Striga hermonthica]|uniref:Ubiquitin-like protease family profile domain-containing protein n=1 Tax=Striga hermonthica TaxID=68872 RepID=A0A9N7NCH3_STRHE|nr:Domain of unknown function (DUF1985 [Striga hermonthica]